MGCFSLLFLEQLLIWLIVIAAAVAIVRIVVPAILGPLGWVAQVLNIIIYAVIAIAVVILVFDLLMCVVGMPLPRVR